MRNKQQHIFFWMAKLPLLLLYISFFTVQLFYNFDIANHSVNATQNSIQKTAKQKDGQATVKKTNSSSEKKTSFRLNKRYHPQPAIVCNTLVYKPLICPISSKLHIHYSSVFIPSSLPSAHSLRGPPNVV